MAAPRGQGRHGRWPYAGLHDREGPTEAPGCDAFQVSFGVCDAPYINQQNPASASCRWPCTQIICYTAQLPVAGCRPTCSVRVSDSMLEAV